VDRVVGAEDAVAGLQGAIESSYGGVSGAIEQVGASRVMALIH
jgi:hypothetical protein